jgi:hypothetical protein
MPQWTAGSPYRTLELVVRHTDAEREYAYDEHPLLGSDNEEVLAAAASGAWTVVDMATDRSVIYAPA